MGNLGNVRKKAFFHEIVPNRDLYCFGYHNLVLLIDGLDIYVFTLHRC